MLQNMYVQEVLARERRENAQRLYLRAQLGPPSRPHLFGFGRLGRRLFGASSGRQPTPAGAPGAIAPSPGVPSGAWPRLREVPPLRVPYLQPRRTVVEAARLLEEPGAPGLLLTKCCGGRPAVVTREDVGRLMPSPATTLSRHEIPELMGRVPVAEAVRSAAPTAGPDEDVRRAVLLMREHDWQPLVVADGDWVYGVVTTGALLAALVRPLSVDDAWC